MGVLERESAYVTSLEDSGQRLTEDLLNYCYDLRRAVGMLRDPRALKALLSIQATSVGLEPEFVGDLCGTGIDLIVAAANGPARFWRGVPLHNRAGTMRDLGECLKLGDLDSASAAKARMTLLSGLGNNDSSVQQAAIAGLYQLRSDPDIQKRHSRWLRSAPRGCEKRSRQGRSRDSGTGCAGTAIGCGRNAVLRHPGRRVQGMPRPARRRAAGRSALPGTVSHSGRSTTKYVFSHVFRIVKSASLLANGSGRRLLEIGRGIVCSDSFRRMPRLELLRLIL